MIEAYSNTHDGERPTPAMVKQILDGSASDINAPAGEQGAGEVNIYQAVLAAEQKPFTTVKGDSAAPGLLSTPTQVDVSGAGGTTAPASLSVYNASNQATKVTAALRQLGPARQIGSTVTENVSAPAAGAAIPAKGAQAAAPITFHVPAGADQINANMIWPDPTNSNILYYILTDPKGRSAARGPRRAASPASPSSCRAAAAAPRRPATPPGRSAPRHADRWRGRPPSPRR